MFEAALTARPDRPFIRYFDGVLSFADVDAAASSLANALLHNGFRAGDRLALYLQNNPGFVIGLIAAWKAGGVAVPINPMNTARELTFALVDTGARALLCLDSLYAEVAADVVAAGDTEVDQVYVTSAHEWQTRDDTRVLGSSRAAPRTGPEVTRLVDLPPVERVQGTVRGEDPALLMYTSGTTGVPKACVNTHANVTAGAEIYRQWFDLDADDTVLAITPVFHITGLIAHIAVALRLGAPLVLAHRFDADVIREAIGEHRPTFVIGTISALVAVVDASSGPRDFVSVRHVASGGAAISPALAEKMENATGQPLTVVYGLTETTSPALAVPVGVRPAVDAESGALSIGVPVTGTQARVIDTDGADMAPGEVGELAIRGPQAARGYWHGPDPDVDHEAADTDETFAPDGEVRTGDVGFVDSDGWFYLLDRKKDMITSAGYKVWPREVEDVFYRHPDVAEVAVVGVPDERRGETVTAFVALEPGRGADVDGLASYASRELAAYKRPRRIVLVDALPKTPTGKILRRELRGD